MKDTSQQDLILIKGELLDIDHIWNIALHCLDEDVGRDAVRYLAILHLNVSISLGIFFAIISKFINLLNTFTSYFRAHDEKTDTNTKEAAAFAKKQWHGLVERCFGHLASAAHVLASKNSLQVLPTIMADDPSQILSMNMATSLMQNLFSENRTSTYALKLQRCLQLLQVFLDMFEAKYVLPDWAMQRHGSLNHGESIVVRIQVHWVWYLAFIDWDIPNDRNLSFLDFKEISF